MSRTKIGAAAVVCCVAVVASGVFAQEGTRRRERLRNAAEAAAGVAETVVETAEGGDAKVNGRVIILQEIMSDDAAEPDGDGRLPDMEVNKGGLVIVEVPDTQSKRTKSGQPKIDQEGGFQPMGKVWGVPMENGKELMGGARTWFLLKPIKAGKFTITLDYKPNGGGEPVKREHVVTVTER